MAETGRIRLDTLQRRLQSGYYELVLLTADVNSRSYTNYYLRLPPALAEVIRENYQLIENYPPYFIYASVHRPNGYWPVYSESDAASRVIGRAQTGRLDRNVRRQASEPTTMPHQQQNSHTSSTVRSTPACPAIGAWRRTGRRASSDGLRLD